MKEIKCPQCGAFLKFEPGTKSLKCHYCDSEFPIIVSDSEVQELDYLEHMARLEEEGDLQEVLSVKCDECGAEITLPPNVTADACPYCATSIIADKASSKKLLKPAYLLPFEATEKETKEIFKRWIKGLWFAPGNLKRLAKVDDGIKGIYVPYWTYDAAGSSFYTGARGTYYMVQVPVVVVRQGREMVETQVVQKIRWEPVQGSVHLHFDDVLVLGSRSLPAHYAQSLEPWDLNNLVDHDEKFLSGFLAESYQLGPKDGFEVARGYMNPAIMNAIRADIGGDVQDIHSSETYFSDIKFKHILLPVWINAYRYHGRLYRFLVNARTGEVQGDRPWSWIKIALFALGMMAAAYGFALMASAQQ